MQPGVHNKGDLGIRSEGVTVKDCLPNVGICSRWGPSTNDVMHEGFVGGGGCSLFHLPRKGIPKYITHGGFGKSRSNFEKS